ncbi:MAG: SDR family oxidoreductase [Rhodospirillaceae bacterium]
MQLDGKVSAVTGAAQGLGRACALRFGAEGAKVLVSDINLDGVEETARMIVEAGGDATAVECDTGDKAQVDAMVAAAVATYGRLDVMLSNAAVLHIADPLELSEDDFDRVLRVNLKGYFLVNQAAARVMAAQGSGSIINMSSIQALITIPEILSYAVAKGGVKQLTVAMALGLANKGVRVNAIGPGTIATEMAMSLMTDPAARNKVMSRTPMGRMGEPDEVASVAVFLASDNASYITGETIYVDGGRLGLNYTVPVNE